MADNIRILPLDAKNIDDFLKVLSQRKSINESFYKNKLLNDKFYGGFIAYLNDNPIGCISYVKRTVSIENKHAQINWFNDWFLIESARGMNLGVKLMKCLSKNKEILCGIITPKKSWEIALKTGLNNTTNFYEFRYPLSPAKIAWFKYKKNGQFTDSIIKRLFRVLIFFIKTYKLTIKPKISSIKYQINTFNQQELEDFEQKHELINFDSSYLSFVVKLIISNNKNIVQIWKIKIDNILVYGYNEKIDNNLTQTVILYFSNNEPQKRIKLIRSIIKIFEKSDIVNFILNESEINKYKITKEFYRKLPFFSTGLNLTPNSVINHIDKESTWTPGL
jgi:hypothetical protein